MLKYPVIETEMYATEQCYLLVVNRVPSQVGEVNKLHVEGPKLSQDAAAGRRPTPVTTNATVEEGGKILGPQIRAIKNILLESQLIQQENKEKLWSFSF